MCPECIIFSLKNLIISSLPSVSVLILISHTPQKSTFLKEFSFFKGKRKKDAFFALGPSEGGRKEPLLGIEPFLVRFLARS